MKIRIIISSVFVCLLLGCLTACQSGGEKPTQNNTAPVSPTNNKGKVVGKSAIGDDLYEKDYETTATGKRIRRSALGVTIRFPDGWKKEDMDFQIDYCQQMMASVEKMDKLKFCTCFLEKVQYYYEPIYVRDSYEHQQPWNQECFAAAQQP
jgi:hypothetical protein